MLKPKTDLSIFERDMSVYSEYNIQKTAMNQIYSSDIELPVCKILYLS